MVMKNACMVCKCRRFVTFRGRSLISDTRLCLTNSLFAHLPVHHCKVTPTPHPTLGFIPLGFIQTRSIQNENVMFTCWQCSQYPGIVATSSTVAARTPFCVYCSQLSIRRPATANKGNSPRGQVVAFSFTAWNVPWSWNRYWGRRQVASIAHWVAATGRVKRVESRSNHRNP